MSSANAHKSPSRVHRLHSPSGSSGKLQPLATEDMRHEGVVPRVSLGVLTLRHRLDAIQQLVSELSGVVLMVHIEVELERPTGLDELHGIEEPPLR